MAFCTNCGTALAEGAKFCGNCGAAVNSNPNKTRKTVFEGEIHKCPRCGEEVPSFTLRCPLCGHEIRGAKTADSVQEFVSKLECIESKRQYEKPLQRLLGHLTEQAKINNIDEQKISLIKSFVIPNTKEDILEFMMLATSNINMQVYDFFNTTVSKSEKEVSNAWLTKAKQAYQKAECSGKNEQNFIQIQKLYDNCIRGIKKSKQKAIIKLALLIGCSLLPWIYIFSFL